MDMRIPPLKIQILLESSPLKSRILVRRLAAHKAAPGGCDRRPDGKGVRVVAGGGGSGGAKDCTPDDTSEIIVDLQWHLPTDSSGISR